MNIIFFSHPTFLGSLSMPRFTKMLVEGMKKKGHNVECWTPKPRFYNLFVPISLMKWFGYIDQYFIFPLEVRNRLKNYQSDTLFVFTDQALGPWVPLVSNRPHVIHCHDFLAQRSALGEILENPISWSGRQYQSYIHRGYSKGKRFISVSEKTKDDLHQFLPSPPSQSEVVYNGLNQEFSPKDPGEVRDLLGKKFRIDLSYGFLLHVGGNQWYKNRSGVIELYEGWRTQSKTALPLLMIGSKANPALLEIHSKSPFKTDIHLLTDIDDDTLKIAYAGASVFLFPSLAEGFGWPIAEAMASGCPVITTNEAPMSEVAGMAAFYISRKPSNSLEANQWAEVSAKAIEKVINLTRTERDRVIKAGRENAKRFDPETTMNKIEEFYKKALNSHKSS